MSIINFDPIIEKTLGGKVNYYHNDPLLPANPFRAIIAGPSGYGKTNLLLNLLINYLKYDIIVLVAKDLHEEKYQFLARIMEEVENHISRLIKTHVKLFFSFDNLEALPKVTEWPSEIKDKTKIIIFDDFINEKHQEKIDDYYIMGRKQGFTCFYLAQRYSEIPKQIRTNSSFFIFFFQKPRDVEGIFRDIGSSVADSLPDFRKLFNHCTQEPNSFMIINNNAKPGKKVRKGLDEFIA
jgi:hypothetical protein